MSTDRLKTQLKEMVEKGEGVGGVCVCVCVFVQGRGIE